MSQNDSDGQPASPEEPSEPGVVPPEALAAELRRAVIEAFVLREGTANVKSPSKKKCSTWTGSD